MAPDNGWTNESGVYCIKNIYNDKVYIGSTVNLIQRKRQHLKNLKRNKHVNKHLQFAYNKYGKDSLEFIILERIKSTKLIPREQYWIDYFNASSREFGYNIAPKADRTEHSEETKELLSEINIERCKNPEYIQKMSETSKRLGLKPPSRKGCKMSDESKRKIGLASKGRVCSEETRNKISNTLKGHSMSEERKRKISESIKRLWDEYGGEHFGRK